MPVTGMLHLLIANSLVATTNALNDNIFGPSYLTSNSCFTYADHSLKGIYVATAIGA